MSNRVRLITGGALVFSVIIAGAMFSYLSLRRAIENDRWLAHTLRVLDELEGSLSVLPHADSTRVGQDGDLSQFQGAVADANTHIAKAQALVSDNPSQERRVQQIRNAISELTALLALAVDLRRERGGDAATAVVKRGQKDADSIRSLIGEMKQQEESLLTARVEKAKGEARIARLSIVAGSGLDLLVLSVSVYLVMMYTIRRQELVARAKLAEVVESADDAIFSKDLDGVVTSWNRGAENLYGYTADEILGKLASIVCAEDHANEWAAIRGQIKQGLRVKNCRAVHIAKDGRVLHVSLSAWPLCDENGGIVGASVMSRDVAAQEKAEEALRQSEEQYRLLFASSPQPMWVAEGKSLKFLTVNDAAILHYGYSRDEFLAMSTRDIFCEESSPETVKDALHPPPRQSAATTCRHRKKDGTIIDVEVAGHPILFQGQAAELVLVTDVTERKLAEAKLRSSEKKFATAFHLSPLAVSIATLPEGRVLDANGALLKILGYEPEEMIGKTAHELGIWTFPKDRERMVQSLNQEDRSIGLETVFTTRSGDTRSVQVFSEAIDLDGVPCVLAVTHDVTERKQLEQQLRQAQRMDAVGRLAGGVAHDFNNMLGVIGGYSDLLRSRVCDEVAKEQIEEIKKASDRAASLTRQLLAFSRRQVLQPTLLDLNERILQLSKMLLRLIGDDVLLIVRPGDSLAAIEADPGQIDQVILNLAVNARDAMPKGGKLILETSNIRLDDSSAFQQGAVKPGPYVMLAISDTGCGMDAETLSHIFEPFFTTKEQGKGTGLGLSTVHGIVTQSEGYIWVASQPAQGSTFKICLPASQKGRVRAKQDAGERRPVTRGSEKILLVEDEESMRKLTKHLLEAPGYQVLEACDGAEAIELAGQHTDIQLLLTDVVMPNLSGPGLADRIKAMNPKIEVIYMSGYTDELLVRHGALGHGITFLEKPFTQDSLIHAVQKALHGAPIGNDDRENAMAKSQAG